ncbi:MAG: FkbM family methyltransferase [Actinomycetota bacterium]
MANKTVTFRPFPGQEFSITGSEACAGCVGELERSGGYYQPDLTALLQRRLPPDAVVVDIGAYIGVVTVLLASLCPKGHVYAFEPVAENFVHLTGNVAANGLDNVTAQRVALFDRDGEVNFEYEPGYPGGSHVGTAGAAVPSVRFDTWARQAGIDRLDLVKLDVEGVELAVLEGAAETLRRFRPILVVECNPVALRRFGEADYERLLRRMRRIYPFVGVIAARGDITPIASVGHLRRILGRRGVVDLVGVPAMPLRQLVRQRALAVVDLAKLSVHENRWRMPEETFVIDPRGIILRPAVATLSAAPGQRIEIPVELTNGSRCWLSSEFPHHPVDVSYRWLDETGARRGSDGRRTGLPEPVGPGRSTRLVATVDVPPVAGRYTLALTLVQDGFAWLDDTEPGCSATMPALIGGDGS